jgi:RHS repeat-associated protein
LSSATLERLDDALNHTALIDAAGRVTSASWTRSGENTETVTWTYDDPTAGKYAKGRLSSMTDPTGTTTYAYDRRGLLRSEQKTAPASPPAGGISSQPYTLAYGYDADGNRTSIQYPTGTTASYGYDFAGRQTSLSFGSTVIVSAAKYLPSGPATELTFGNGTTKTMQFDARYRPLENKLSLGMTTIADYTYTNDAAGNIAAIADAVDAGYSRTFAYDEVNRLIQANTGPALWVNGSYSYDRMGNMLHRSLGGVLVPSTETDPDSGSTTIPIRTSDFTYVGTTSKLDTVGENGLFRYVTYDAAGNERSYAATRTYLPRENLLARIEDDGEGVDHHVVNYQYDGRGVRVVRTEIPVADPNNLPAKRTFVYSPELQLLTVTQDDCPNLWGKRAITNDIFLPRYQILYFAGQPVAQIDGTTTATRFTFTDHLGTPLLQTDATGTIIWRAEYEPFGNIWTLRAGTATGESPGTSIEQPLRFPGQEVATRWEGSEENYNIFRWYRSAWGRYTQGDPIGLEGGVNMFAYAEDEPTTNDDPAGLSSRNCACGLTRAPEYVPGGTVRPGTTIRWHAEFLNDATHKPECCEVRQNIAWNRGGRPSGFPPELQDYAWHEDRDSQDHRYGRRTGPYSGPADYDNYHDDEYDGYDRPRPRRNQRWAFQLIVVDVCNGERLIYTSPVIVVRH